MVVVVVDAYDERVCVCASEDKTGGGGGGGGGGTEQPNDPNKPPINNDHRPPRPTSDAGNDPNVNVNPNPTYQTPVGCSLTHSLRRAVTDPLIIISFSSPTLSFIPDLKPFSANPYDCSLSFSSSGLTT